MGNTWYPLFSSSLEVSAPWMPKGSQILLWTPTMPPNMVAFWPWNSASLESSLGMEGTWYPFLSSPLAVLASGMLRDSRILL